MLIVTLKQGMKRQTQLSLKTSDGEIRIVLTQIKGKQVRLGVIAPKTIKADRVEITKEDDGTTTESKPKYHSNIDEYRRILSTYVNSEAFKE